MTSVLPDVLPLRAYLRETVWGGRRLAELYNKPLPPHQPIGESFEVSALPERDSVVASGPLEGQPLGQVVSQYSEALVGATTVERYGREFPLLIKIIDAAQDLSVQVHPDDRYARDRKLGTFGKMEAWYVVHSDGGRVALGLEDGVGRAELVRAIREGTVEEAVRFHSVAPGDVVSLPPGTVHALCRGVMVYEVQQSSDITFRLYDYGRLGLDGKPRELHTEEALEVIDFETGPRQPEPAGHLGQRACVVEDQHYRLDGGHLSEEITVEAGETFAALTITQGSVQVKGADGTTCDLGIGDSALIPAGRSVSVAPGAGQSADYLLAFPGRG